MTSQDTAPTTTGTGESATDSPVIRRDDPLGSIRAMAESHNNWGRWGEDDVLGTLNFIDAAQARRSRSPGHDGRGLLAVPVVRHQRPAEGLAAPHQPGAHHDRHRRRRRARQPGLPARHRRRGRRHRHAAAVLHPVGRPRPHLRPRQGLERPRAQGDVVTTEGDLVTGIETAAARSSAAACCSTSAARSATGRRRRAAGRFRHHRRTPRARPSTRRAAAQRSAAATSLLVRTGQLTRVAPRRLGRLRRRRPPRACPSPPPPGCTAARSRAIATDTWGFEVRPNEFDGAFQPLHQVAIPNLGLFLGEMWDLGRPRGRLRGRRRVRLPAHRRAPAHYRRRRIARQPDRPPVAFSTTAPQPSSVTPSIQRSQRWQQYRTSESSGREPRD